MDIVKYEARVIQKHDTETNWNNSTFIPLNGELIIYDIDSYYPYQRFKIGDGVKIVKELPFIIHNPIWSGTMAQYDAIKSYIAIGTIICITDEESERPDEPEDSDSTTAKLGAAILGLMKLGQD